MGDEDDMDLDIEDLVLLVKAVQGNIRRVVGREEDALTRAYLECAEKIMSEGVTYLASAMVAREVKGVDSRQLNLFSPEVSS